MPHAYTPGLTVAERTTIRRLRLLPLSGQVLCEVGDEVRANDPIARTELPGAVQAVNVVNRLSINPAQIERFMLKAPGDAVSEGEPIAENKPFIKWFKTTVTSPVTGTVETVSNVTGQVMLREPPRPVEIDAYVDGRVVEVVEAEGAVVETTGTLVQGILGVGGEAHGELGCLVDSPDDVLTLADLPADGLEGHVVVCGALVTHEVLARLRELRVAAVIVGGFDADDLRDLLGYDLGVAITGSEDIGLTLVLTEGFGLMPIAQRTFDLLQSRRGSMASVSGATQIRAGVLRPEIVIPWPAGQRPAERAARVEAGMQIGDTVRVIREPHFGQIVEVVALPSEPAQIETEAKVRIAEVQLPDGQTIVVPRANLELIQT